MLDLISVLKKLTNKSSNKPSHTVGVFALKIEVMERRK